jgi:two-component system cell cycle response regulator DivK
MTAGAPEKAGTVLVVDDNDDVRRLVRKVLERAGFKVAEANSGKVALEEAEQILPDLILMDIRLPGTVNGLQATKELKENSLTSRIPVVALTAGVMDRDRQMALECGCSGFIGKPIDITELAALVKKFITRGAVTPR